jgi:membrane protease YdiL (CAAX protease family)
MLNGMNDTQPEKPSARPSAALALFLLALAFLVNIAAGFIVPEIPSQWFSLGLLFAELISFGLPCLILMRNADTGVFLIPQTRAGANLTRSSITANSAALRPPYGRSVFFGIVASLFLVGVMSLWQSFLYLAGVDITVLMGDVNYGSLLTALLVAAVAPAVCEELFFRGLLMTSLEPYGAGFAITVSGVLFAMMHIEIAALPVHLILGLTLSFVAYASRNIFIPMLIHFSYNATLICLQYYMNSLGLAEQSSASSMLLTPALAIQIILQTLIYFAIFASLLRTLIIRTAPKKAEADTIELTEIDETASVTFAVKVRTKIPLALLISICVIFAVFIVFYALETIALMRILFI